MIINPSLFVLSRKKKKKKKQNLKLKDQVEVDLRLVSHSPWCPANKPLLCCKHLLSEFGFQHHRHTSPCLVSYTNNWLNKLPIFNHNLTLIIQMSSLLVCFSNYFSFSLFFKDSLNLET